MSKALTKAHIVKLIEGIYAKIDKNSEGMEAHVAMEDKTNIRLMKDVHNLQREIKEL